MTCKLTKYFNSPMEFQKLLDGIATEFVSSYNRFHFEELEQLQ